MKQTAEGLTIRTGHNTREALERNRILKSFFTRQGLPLNDIWRESPGDIELENRQLLELSRWVCVYGACPDRAKLEDMGYLYPPVDPDINPDADWVRFERWMQGLPLTWTLPDHLSTSEDLHEVDDAEAGRRLEEVTAYLAERNVVVDFVEGVPARPALEYLLKTTREQPFDYTDELTVTHLMGCTGCCEQCFQEPWCEMARDSYWSGGFSAGREGLCG